MRSLLAILLLVVLLVMGCARSTETPPIPPSTPSQTSVPQTKPAFKEPTYKYVTVKPTGWFKTGQEAGVILHGTGFNESGGPLILNHPGKIATDGEHLIAADTWNNRVLIWNEIPTRSNKTPDLVLGQPDFNSTSPGSALNQLDHPIQISTDGKRLVVADQSNRRVLVWSEIPTNNGQPADFEIKIINRSKDIADLPPTAQLSMVPGVLVYSDSLFVADTGGNRVLIWSKFPESELDEPDIVIGQKDFVSRYPSNSKDKLFMPTYLSFDGSFLWVGEMKWSNRLLRFSVQPND